MNHGTCGAILLNKAYLDVIAEMDQYGSFPSQIREIASLKVATVVERNTPAAQQPSSAEKEQTSSDTSAKDDAVTDEVYTIFVSGIDTRGSEIINTRSDVMLLQSRSLWSPHPEIILCPCLFPTVCRIS